MHVSFCDLTGQVVTLMRVHSRQDNGFYVYSVQQQQRRSFCSRQPHQVHSFGVERSEEHNRRAIAEAGKEGVRNGMSNYVFLTRIDTRIQAVNHIFPL